MKASNIFTFRTIIAPDTKGFHGSVPALKGCHTWGKTIVETQRHLREAIQVYCESRMAHGESIPQDASLEAFETLELPRVPVRRSRQYA